MNQDIERLFAEVPLAEHSNLRVLTLERVGYFVREIERFRTRVGAEKSGIHILDVACGIGKNSFPLAHLGYAVSGIDNGQASIDYLDEHNTYDHFHPILFDLLEDDYSNLPKGYNVILVAAILEHLPDPGRVLGELLDRAQRPCLVVGDIPNGYGAAELSHDLRQKVQSRWGETGWYKRFSSRFRYKTRNDETDSVTLTDTPHVCDFHYGKLKRLLRDLDLRGIRVENGNLLVGTPVLHKLLYSSEAVQRLDVRVSKWFPRFLGNGWSFSGERGAD